MIGGDRGSATHSPVVCLGKPVGKPGIALGRPFRIELDTRSAIGLAHNRDGHVDSFLRASNETRGAIHRFQLDTRILYGAQCRVPSAVIRGLRNVVRDGLRRWRGLIGCAACQQRARRCECDEQAWKSRHSGLFRDGINCYANLTPLVPGRNGYVLDMDRTRPSSTGMVVTRWRIARGRPLTLRAAVWTRRRKAPSARRCCLPGR